MSNNPKQLSSKEEREIEMARMAFDRLKTIKDDFIGFVTILKRQGRDEFTQKELSDCIIAMEEQIDDLLFDKYCGCADAGVIDSLPVTPEMAVWKANEKRRRLDLARINQNPATILAQGGEV